MSSMENIMDASETENWVEQHSDATAEWSTRRVGRKERRDVDKAKEASELEPSNLDTTTEAFEPGEVVEGETLTLGSEGQGESLHGTNSSPSHPLEYSSTGKHPTMIQQD